MGIAGAQSTGPVGSRFYYQRDAVIVNGSPVVQPILDLGTITAATPAFTPTPVSLVDSDGGVRRVIDETVTQMEEVYDIKCNNLNLDNLALAFMANPPVVYDPVGTGLTTGQTGSAFTVVPHDSQPGRLVKISDANGNPVFGIASIEAIHFNASGGTALVPYDPTTGLGDYEVYSFERGLIRLMPTSTVATTPGKIYISYTTRAVLGLRTIFPQTQACTSKGKGILIWSRCSNAEQSARVGRFSLTPTTNTWSDSAYSDIGFRLRVLYDPTILINPAGAYSYWLGALPALA